MVGLRKVCGNFHGHRIERFRINLVVHKGWLQRDSAFRIAVRRSKGRKVTRHHCRGRNETSHVFRILPKRGALITSKEKELVLEYRSADCGAELIALQRAVLLVARYGVHSHDIGRRTKDT